MIVWTWAFCVVVGSLTAQVQEAAPWWVTALFFAAFLVLAHVIGAH